MVEPYAVVKLDVNSPQRHQLGTMAIQVVTVNNYGAGKHQQRQQNPLGSVLQEARIAPLADQHRRKQPGHQKEHLHTKTVNHINDHRIQYMNFDGLIGP